MRCAGLPDRWLFLRLPPPDRQRCLATAAALPSQAFPLPNWLQIRRYRAFCKFCRLCPCRSPAGPAFAPVLRWQAARLACESSESTSALALDTLPPPPPSPSDRPSRPLAAGHGDPILRPSPLGDSWPILFRHLTFPHDGLCMAAEPGSSTPPGQRIATRPVPFSSTAYGQGVSIYLLGTAAPPSLPLRVSRTTGSRTPNHLCMRHPHILDGQHPLVVLMFLLLNFSFFSLSSV